MENALPIVILVGIVILALFMILRSVNLWYWKISDRIELQEKQIRNQKVILSTLEEAVELLKKLNAK
jgi:cell division protein FtsL